jgi:pimeloyl-ACP methyl ester carboxylesterase
MTKLAFHFHDDGSDGHPVVFLHAFPLHSAMWRAQHEALSGVARCISFDVSGLGRSALPATPNMLEHLVDDLFSLLDFLQISSALLCGISMGGYIALRAVEREPARVSGLLLADTQAGADGNEAKQKRAAAIRALRADGSAPYVENFLKAALCPHTHEHQPHVVAAARALMLDSTAQGMAHGLAVLASRTDTTGALSGIRVPTRVVVGEQDAVTPVQVMREMADKILGADFHVLPNAGHLSNLEAPELFNRLLVEHVEHVRTARK